MTSFSVPFLNRTRKNLWPLRCPHPMIWSISKERTYFFFKMNFYCAKSGVYLFLVWSWILWLSLWLHTDFPLAPKWIHFQENPTISHDIFPTKLIKRNKKTQKKKSNEIYWSVHVRASFFHSRINLFPIEYIRIHYLSSYFSITDNGFNLMQIFIASTICTHNVECGLMSFFGNFINENKLKIFSVLIGVDSNKIS